MRTFTRTIPYLLLPLLFVGCFETTLNLGTLADAPKVDPRYCGNWHFDWDQPGAAELIVRNIDGKQLYAEWSSKKEGKTEVLRMSGYFVLVKETTFAQLTPMEADGQLQPKHLIMKVLLDGDRLTLTNLKQDFFNDVTTDAALRKKVEENISNPAMFEDVGTGTRVVTQP